MERWGKRNSFWKIKVFVMKSCMREGWKELQGSLQWGRAGWVCAVLVTAPGLAVRIREEFDVPLDISHTCSISATIVCSSECLLGLLSLSISLFQSLCCAGSWGGEDRQVTHGTAPLPALASVWGSSGNHRDTDNVSEPKQTTPAHNSIPLCKCWACRCSWDNCAWK